MTLKKRIVAAALAVAAIIAVAVTVGVLVNSKVQSVPEHSETFAGYVSDAEYATREQAARAFVSEQLSGASATPGYSELKILGEMSDAEIDDIDSLVSKSRAVTSGVESGEHCEIEYITDGKTRKIKADILHKESGAFSYRVRLPEVGEQPTKAYIDSVIDGDNYLNCTSTSRISAALASVYVTYMQTIKYADDKAYFKQELPGTISDAYLREADDRLIVYMRNPMDKDDENVYTESELNDILRKYGYKLENVYLTRGGEKIDIHDMHSMSDVTDFAFMMPIDCSYFVKTDYGFAMTDDKFMAACVAMIGKDQAEQVEKYWHDYMVNFFAEYYVTEGRLSRICITLQMMCEKELLSMTVVTDYGDFGATEVTIPHD